MRGPLVHRHRLLHRHRLSARLWHWTNAAAFFIMLMSGLMVFNAHPRLYWGEAGANHDPAWLEIGATQSGKGLVKLGALRVPTTGVLGISGDDRRAFPGWMTLPSRYSLADARLWHMAFAWVLSLGLLAYLPGAIIRARQRQPAYNPAQRRAYAMVRFALLPLMIWTGLAMAPGMDAAWPWLTELVGGRQSARSLHFIAAIALLAFTAGHLALLLVSRPLNLLRGMITGWQREEAP